MSLKSRSLLEKFRHEIKQGTSTIIRRQRCISWQRIGNRIYHDTSNRAINYTWTVLSLTIQIKDNIKGHKCFTAQSHYDIITKGEDVETLIAKIVPLVLCLGLGNLFRKKDLLKAPTIEDLKFIVINIALPPVLFQAFSRAEITLSLLTIPIAVFLLCLLLFGAGKYFQKTLVKDMRYTPFFTTGFEFGMLGSALLLSLFGIAAIKNISLIIIGHEIFIWFVYFPFIESGKKPVREIAISAAKSPIVIAIITALCINAGGLQNFIEKGFSGSVIDAVTQTLANLIAPLILFIIGYNLTLSLRFFKKIVPYLMLRLLLVATGGTLLILLLHLLHPEYVKHYFLYILLFILLPPPYILPLFINTDDEREIVFFSGANIYYTVLSFVLIFIVLALFQLEYLTV